MQDLLAIRATCTCVFVALVLSLGLDQVGQDLPQVRCTVPARRQRRGEGRAMSQERWGPLGPHLAELQSRCYLCSRWRPYAETIQWVNWLACYMTYCCIDCLADPLKEAGMRAYGWSKV